MLCRCNSPPVFLDAKVTALTPPLRCPSLLPQPPSFGGVMVGVLSVYIVTPSELVDAFWVLWLPHALPLYFPLQSCPCQRHHESATVPPRRESMVVALRLHPSTAAGTAPVAAPHAGGGTPGRGTPGDHGRPAPTNHAEGGGGIALHERDGVN